MEASSVTILRVSMLNIKKSDVIADGTSGSGFSRFTIRGKIQHLRGLRALILVDVYEF